MKTLKILQDWAPNYWRLFLFAKFTKTIIEKEEFKMKHLWNLLVTGFVVSIGVDIGTKVWDEVLEDKIDVLVDRLKKKD